MSRLAQTRSHEEGVDELNRDISISPQLRMSCHYNEMKAKKVDEAVEWADVVVLQRMATESALNLYDGIKKKGKPIVHESDDMCEMLPKGNPAFFYWRQEERLRLHAECFKRADLVTTTNPRLAKFYQDSYGTPVVVLPNQIDYQSWRWNTVDFKKGPGVTVGYMCSESHVVDMEILKELIPWMLETFPETKFEFCGHMPDWATGMKRVSVRSGQVMEVPKMIAHWDIGLSPLIDHPFNVTGKSDIKFLEYSCASVASLMANLKPYRGTIQQKSTGLLAKWDDVEDWKRKLGSLIRRPNFRAQLVQNSHYWVKQHRTLAGNIANWFRVYADLATGRIPKNSAPEESPALVGV